MSDNMSDKIINIDSLKYYNDKINQTKQDVLISGQNIKTINGESILGEGNIEIDEGNPDANVSAVDTSETLDDVDGNTYVKYVAQTLTEEQKAQVRENIGAVSQNNIKTINGESIVGSGDIVISGGSSSGGNVEAITYSHEELNDRPIRDAKDLTTGELVYFTGDARYIMADGGILTDVLDDIRNLIGTSSSAYPEIYHDSSETEVGILPNQFHIWDEVSDLTLYLIQEGTAYAEEFLFQFTSGSEPTTLSLPDDIKWIGGGTPTIEANKIYQISILKGLGSISSWSK